MKEDEEMPKNYISIDFSKVKGFNNMGEGAQMVFKHVYRKHNSSLGVIEKNKWLPTKVKVNGNHLIVNFKNDEWLHYYQNGTWG